MEHQAAPSERLDSFVHDWLVTTIGPKAEYAYSRVDGSRSEVFVVTVVSSRPTHFVVKESCPAEVAALRLFERAGITGVPLILAADTSANPNLLLMPRYGGAHGRFGALPDAVLESLACIHSRFSDQSADFGVVKRLSFERLSGWAFGDMSIYSPELRVKMASIRSSMDALEAMAQRFPSTLVHWDLHPDNILIEGHGAIILDWEHACIGPALLDLSNMITWNSTYFRYYAAAWERYSGDMFDWELKRREFELCQALTAIRYIFVPAGGGDQARSEVMADGVIDYLRRST